MKVPSDIASGRPWYPRGAMVFLGLVLIASLAIAIREGFDQTAGGDFAVFYRAGRDFAAGQALYGSVEGERSFFYPPFAALIFQVLTLLPLVPSAVVFSIASVLTAVGCYRLTGTILETAFPGRRIHWWPFVGGVLFSHRYILNNLNLVQVNLFLFAIVLYAFLLFVRHKTAWAAFLFMIAAGLKVMPVILVAWAIARAPRTAWRGALAGAVVVILLPILWRGQVRGVQDLVDYNTSFLAAFQSGRVVADYTNQNLASGIFRATQPSANPEDLDYQIIDLAPQTTKTLTLLALGTVALAFGCATLLRAWRRMDIHAVELVGALLAWHMISGITWKAHLVSFLFVFIFFLSCRPERFPTLPRVLWSVSIVLMAVLAFVGRDIVGRTAHYYFGGYSSLTVMMVPMFALAIWMMASGEWATLQAAPSRGPPRAPDACLSVAGRPARR